MTTLFFFSSGYLKAKQYMDEENYDKIISECTKEIESGGRYTAEALLLRATFYLLIGNATAAQPDLDRVINMQDANVKVHTWLCWHQDSVTTTVDENDFKELQFIILLTYQYVRSLSVFGIKKNVMKIVPRNTPVSCVVLDLSHFLTVYLINYKQTYSRHAPSLFFYLISAAASQCFDQAWQHVYAAAAAPALYARLQHGGRDRHTQPWRVSPQGSGRTWNRLPLVIFPN